MRKFTLGMLACAQLLPLLLLGCAGDQLRRPDIGSNEVPPAGQGLLLTRINLKYASYCRPENPTRLTIVDDRSPSTSVATIPVNEGDNLRTITLPPANYNWRGVYVDTYAKEFKGKLPFVVQANKANYVGDLDVVVDFCSVKGWDTASKQFALTVANRADDVRSLYQTRYASAAEHFAFTPALTQDLRK